jgi:signal transduction histidine kinase
LEKLRQEMKTRERIEKAKVEEREKVRARSSRDFHDEAGNKLTKISLYTGLLKTKANSDEEMMNFVNGIEANLKELSSGMRDFIWVLDPKHDLLQDTLLRIKEFGDSLFEHSETEFNYINQIPEAFNPSLDLNTRRNLLMIFKEGMNNCLKYAEAHQVKMITKLENDRLIIRLIDDGMGFNKDNLRRVNGLNNMKDRAEESGGELAFDASPGIGTAITFTKQIYPNG